MKQLRYILAMLIAMLLCMTACQPSRSDYVLSSGDMEDLLYDIHRAHFLVQDGKDTREDGSLQYALFLKVLEKHNVTQTEWDSSMVYYCRHSDELASIYKHLTSRLEREAEDIGANVTESDDSTNIWNGEQNFILTTYQPNTTRQWSIPTDTLLKAGEKLNLRFSALFLKPDESMHAECVLAVRLTNDSVVVTNQSINRTGIYNLRISDTEAQGIKEVKGMFMMYRNAIGGVSRNNEIPSQVLCIRDIVLLHEQDTPQRTTPENNIPDQSAPTNERIPDSPDGSPQRLTIPDRELRLSKPESTAL